MINCSKNQQLVLFTQKRNYKNTNYLLTNTLNKPMLSLLKSHSALRPNTLFDVVGYDLAKNPIELFHTPGDIRQVTLANVTSLVNSSQTIIITSNYSQVLDLSKTYASSSFYIREVREMFGVHHMETDDTRNLLLTYGDSSAPLVKGTSVWGASEFRYQPRLDSLTESGVNIFTI